MNPAAIRTAIVEGLDARPAWDDVTLFRYPAGKLAERGSGFMLGDVEDVQSSDIDLGAGTHEVSYQLLGGLWIAGSGSEDDDYQTVEAAALALVGDLQAWIISVRHGKGLSIANTVIDFLELGEWELVFTADPAAIVGLALSITEIV